MNGFGEGFRRGDGHVEERSLRNGLSFSSFTAILFRERFPATVREGFFCVVSMKDTRTAASAKAERTLKRIFIGT